MTPRAKARLKATVDALRAHSVAYTHTVVVLRDPDEGQDYESLNAEALDILADAANRVRFVVRIIRTDP